MRRYDGTYNNQLAQLRLAETIIENVKGVLRCTNTLTY